MVAPGLAAPAQVWYHAEFTPPALLHLRVQGSAQGLLPACRAGGAGAPRSRAGRTPGTSGGCLFLPFSGKHPSAYIPCKLRGSQQRIYLTWLTPFFSQSKHSLLAQSWGTAWTTGISAESFPLLSLTLLPCAVGSRNWEQHHNGSTVPSFLPDLSAGGEVVGGEDVGGEV